MSDYECITFAQHGPRAVLTLNRPDVLNALNNQMIDEALDAMQRVSADTRVLVVRGSGDKALAAGADLVEMQQRTMWTDLDPGPRRDLAHRLEFAPFVTIAAIQGYALGGGFELALACHLRAVNTSAVVGLPETRLGILPGNGGTARLTRLLGPGRAMQLILLGEHIPAQEAYQMGIANWKFADDTFEQDLEKVLDRLERMAPISTRAVIDCITRAPDLTLEQAVENEHRWFQVCLQSADKQEGVSAFLEKRHPKFGRNN